MDSNEKNVRQTSRIYYILGTDILETVVAMCVVSVRLILSSFRPIVQNKPRLNPISRFRVTENSTDFSILFIYTRIDKFFQIFLLVTHHELHKNLQVSSTSGSILEF